MWNGGEGCNGTTC